MIIIIIKINYSLLFVNRIIHIMHIRFQKQSIRFQEE